MKVCIGNRARAAGFTLLEALVVMALLGVMVSLAAPAMSALRLQHRLQAEAEGLWSSLVLARSEALRRQQRVTVCARAQGLASTCDASGLWQQGWLVFADANGNAQLDPGEALLEARDAVPDPLRLTVSSTVKAYLPTAPRGAVPLPRARSWPGPGAFAGRARRRAGRW